MTRQFHLNEHETRIMHFLQRGYTNQDISTQCGISVNTIKYHLKRMYKKLAVHNRAEAVYKYKNER